MNQPHIDPSKIRRNQILGYVLFFGCILGGLVFWGYQFELIGVTTVEDWRALEDNWKRNEMLDEEWNRLRRKWWSSTDGFVFLTGYHKVKEKKFGYAENGAPDTNEMHGIEWAHRVAAGKCVRASKSSMPLKEAVKGCHEKIWPNDRLSSDDTQLLDLATTTCAIMLGIDDLDAELPSRTLSAFDGCMDKQLSDSLDFPL